MMSDEILFQDADGNNFIGTCYQGFMDGSELFSMIEVTTMFVVVVSRYRRKQEGLLTGNNRQRA
jgi:hypothetical protein